MANINIINKISSIYNLRDLSTTPRIISSDTEVARVITLAQTIETNAAIMHIQNLISKNDFWCVRILVRALCLELQTDRHDYVYRNSWFKPTF